MARIAFIGLGNMGGGMAANLVKAGHEVRAFDLSEDALASLRDPLGDRRESVLLISVHLCQSVARQCVSE